MKPIDELIRDKEASNGVFADTATIAQLLKAVLRRGKNWEGLGPDGKEALEQVATAIARILTGDATDAQHWTGAAAYLRMGAKTTDGGITHGIEQITKRLKTIPNPPEGGA
jgi:hypothetical protein